MSDRQTSMNIDQLTCMVCLALASAIRKKEIRQQDWVSVGELLRDHPDILREVREWFYQVSVDDLQTPALREEVRQRGTTAEEIARLGARGFMHRVLFPLTLTGMFRHARAALDDPEVVAAPHPFTFGSPVEPNRAAEVARLLDGLLESVADLP